MIDTTEILREILQPLIIFIIVTALATEVVKAIFRAFAVALQKKAVLINLAIATGLAVGWGLTVLPEPQIAEARWFAMALTALIIAGAAAGLYEFARDHIPWLQEIQKHIAKQE